jgi:hypothetical protein
MSLETMMIILIAMGMVGLSLAFVIIATLSRFEKILERMNDDI